MKNTASSIDEYLAQLPADRADAMHRLRQLAREKLPDGFTEVMGYGMPGYVVPHSLYPAGYHCDPKLPLPFLNFASQKNFIAVYHMGLYAMPELLDWFTKAYAERVKGKLDMGKSCIRFKKTELIPYELLGELFEKVSVEDWVNCYESNFKR